jgi:hypothetical protein
MDIRKIIREEVADTLSYRWIEFRVKHDTGKTKVYDVVAKERGEMLGEVKWFARWRKYAFFPAPGTLYEEDCLKDIASFLLKLKEERKSSTNALKTV